MPTPTPTLVGALTNPFTAAVKASHRVGMTRGVGGSVHPSMAAGQCIEPDLSWMTNTSTGICCVSALVARHEASGSSGPPPPEPDGRPPVVPVVMMVVVLVTAQAPPAPPAAVVVVTFDPALPDVVVSVSGG